MMPTVSVCKRALEFLDRFDPATLKPDRLRQLRAVELLEGIATPAARDWLSELAKGAAEAALSLARSGQKRRRNCVPQRSALRAHRPTEASAGAGGAAMLAASPEQHR